MYAFGASSMDDPTVDVVVGSDSSLADVGRAGAGAGAASSVEVDDGALRFLFFFFELEEVDGEGAMGRSSDDALVEGE